MPKGPKGQKRPADVIGNATKVAQNLMPNLAMAPTVHRFCRSSYCASRRR